MELQWPLIIFSTFLAWSAGLFATQGVFALKGVGIKSQMKAVIVAVVILAIGGIAVFFHLEHPERMLNGFGNPTSGITQELIAIVLMGIIMVLMFFFLRRTGDKPEIPKPISILAIITAAVLIFACGHSYMMASRPAWDCFTQILSLYGAACGLGPATFALIMALDKAKTAKAGAADEACEASSEATDSAEAAEAAEASDTTEAAEETASIASETKANCISQFLTTANFTEKASFIGAIINAAITVIFMITMSFADYTTFDATYFDPTAPTKAMVDATAIGVFSSDAIVFTLITLLMAVVSIVAVVLGKKKNDAKTFGIIAVVALVLCAIFLRVTFYVMGVSVYPYYL